MVILAADSHVHSEWSWDAGSDPASAGSMLRTCRRAADIGLPAVVFTEHVDLETDWRAEPGDLGGGTAEVYLAPNGVVRVPPFDLGGYLEAVAECRARFPGLRILTGVEFGQPHRWERAVSDVVASGLIDRVNGSLHLLPDGRGGRSEPSTLYRSQDAADVLTAYLAEIPRMAGSAAPFEVVTHIDYAVRTWPTTVVGPFDPRRFEDGFRSAMRAIAASGRALEMNTRRLWPWIPQWWAEEGGLVVTFGSDAHRAEDLAAHFPEATAMVEHFGFAPGSRPEDFWTR